MNPHRFPLRLTCMVTLLIAFFAFAGCGTQNRVPTAPLVASTPTGTGLRSLKGQLAAVVGVQDQLGDALLDLDGVVGDGVEIGDDGAPILKVYVSTTGLLIPSQLGGVPVVQEVVPGFAPFSLTGRYRPLPIGVSTGNANDCVIPGTISCVVRNGNRRYLLSCNHVFARQNQASLGETIVQPARLDASPDCAPSAPDDAVAVLADFEPLKFGKGKNYFDAAIAEITIRKNDVTSATPDGFYGAPGATPVDGTVGLHVQKVGRTTEWTHAKIKAIDVKLKITYPSGVAKFVGVMMTTKDFGAFGDSGSLVVTDDDDRAPVGLLFAGDNRGRGVVCPIGPVLARFGVTISTH
jgi:hypothetical protein